MDKKRFKNPWFWIGIIGVILSAMNVNPETFTSWGVLLESVKALLANPFMIGSVSIAVLGVFVDPTTKGIGDKK